MSPGKTESCCLVALPDEPGNAPDQGGLTASKAHAISNCDSHSCLFIVCLASVAASPVLIVDEGTSAIKGLDVGHSLGLPCFWVTFLGLF